jgi:hypothetical protein
MNPLGKNPCSLRKGSVQLLLHMNLQSAASYFNETRSHYVARIHTGRMFHRNPVNARRSHHRQQVRQLTALA